MWLVGGQVGEEVLVGMALALAVSVGGEVGAATGPSAGTSPESVPDRLVRWYRSVSSGLRTTAPEALRFIGSHAVVALVSVAVLVAAAAMGTWWRTRRGLAQRVRMVALPTESF